ncbi:MAG: nucleotidyltransferase domain-containing protein [Candidatus Pacebacteria bacterium]|nr:nucleotidyltransferase domain-containing protein [Candidatus Paceibacterota bacterium]
MNNETFEKTESISLKEKAEISIEKAKEIILKEIPNEEILAIYIKGSYVQGELNDKSDVDLVVILKTEEYLPAIYEISKKFGDTTDPKFQSVAYTISELLTGEKEYNHTVTSPPSVFVKHIDELPLIYGSKPEGKLFTRTDIKDLTALLSVFEKTFIPDFNNKKFSFNALVKQVLWLVEREQRALGLLPEYSWQKLADSIKDKNHIIHRALEYRRRINVSKEKQEEFLTDLKRYIDLLNQKYN